MVEVRTHEGIPTGELRDRWSRLVERDPDATVFHTPDYLETWLSELGRSTAAQVRTVHRDGSLIGVVPEAREREGSPRGPRRVIRFLGGLEVTDYLGPVSAPGDRDTVARAYLDTLAEDRDWDELIAGGLPLDSGWIEHLTEHAEHHGLHVGERSDEDVCPWVDLSGGYDEYLGRLSAKQRQEQHRKLRKLAREVGPVDLREVPAREVPERLGVFLEMAGGTPVDEGPEARVSEKTRFFNKDEMRSFFVALARSLAGRGGFRLHLLDVAGSPGAAAVSLVWDRHWGLYNTAFEEVLGSFAPGMVLITALIREAAEEGHEVFDLLRGDEPYKYRFGATDRILGRIIVARETP